MKKLLIIAMLAVGCTGVYAQSIITSASSLNMTEDDFADIYGSVAEYNLQSTSFADGRAILFTDAKATYLKFFCNILANNGYSKEVVYDNGSNWISYELQPTVYSAEKKQSILIKASFDESNARMKKVVITGNPTLLVNLFLYYWATDINIDNVKSGKYIYRDVASDRVVFDWKGTQPKIMIVSNPNIKGVIPKK